MENDVIVIGGGHNGLTTAALLAKEGRKVLLLEKRDKWGGLAASEEFHPHYRTQGLLQDTSGLMPSVVSELKLGQRGLSFAPDTGVWIPQKDGAGFILYEDVGKTQEEIRKLSAQDAKRYAEFRFFVARISKALQRTLENPPPSLISNGGGNFSKLIKTGLSLRLLGEKTLLELLRIGPMCVADWLSEWFESELLKAALAGPALWGTALGPRSAGTVMTWLIRECRKNSQVLGGPAALVKALVSACEHYGVELKNNCAVADIRVLSGRVQGVTLESGEKLNAPVVASALDPKRTLLDLLAPVDLPLQLEREIRAFKMRGTAAKVHLALKGPLVFSAIGKPYEAVRMAESLENLERASDAIKYGEFSKIPYLELRVPTLSDPNLAPPGHHVVDILLHFAPYELQGGWSPERRKDLGDVVVKTLERHAPDLRKNLVFLEVLTPVDLEKRYGLTGGHVYHGEHTLDQLYALRPTPRCSQYATPIQGLFLCGSGCHPGGGITSAPGALAAQAIQQR